MDNATLKQKIHPTAFPLASELYSTLSSLIVDQSARAKASPDDMLGKLDSFFCDLSEAFPPEPKLASAKPLSAKKG